jgi:DNA-binding transcriptional regulator YiaG
MSKSAKTTKRRPSVAERMVQRLQDFTEALESGADISERFTCRTVRRAVPLTVYHARLVRETRDLLAASQTVFARFLGVSAQTVRAWEQGVNTPSPLASRFLDEIRHDPSYWRARLRETLLRAAAQ